MHFDPNAVKVGIVRNSDDIHDLIQWAKTVPDQLIGVDVETDGLNWYDGRLRLVQFGTLHEGWAIPFEANQMIVQEVIEILWSRDKFFVGHNFKFDLHWIDRHAGWLPDDFARLHDTMTLASVINSSGSKKLKDLAEHYVWSGAKIGEDRLKADMKEGGWTWGTVPVMLPSYWIYGTLDTILTVHLFYRLYARAKEAGCLEAYETERAATRPLFFIERNGMMVDGEHVANERLKLLARNEEIEHEVAMKYGVENINSGPQLALAFIDAGIKLTAKTDTGKWRMDRDTFDFIAATTDHPLVNLVKEHRSGLKIANTYYLNFQNFQRSDGRIHPHYYPTQARTGRMSAQEPAILTVPRPDEDKSAAVRAVRNSIVAPEGRVLISTDFSNVEARVFAHFAGEESMKQAFRDGVNLHKFTASKIFNRPIESIDKQHSEYTVAKNTFFCTLFGGGATKIAITAGVPIAEGEAAQAGLYAAFPGIKAFQRRSIEMAVDNLNAHGQAFVRGIDGRILAMVETDDRYYAFTNWQIQSAACVILKKRLAVLDAMGMSDYLVAAIHDEVVAEIPEEFEPEFKLIMSEAMEDHHMLSLPIVASIGDGAVRWGDAK